MCAVQVLNLSSFCVVCVGKINQKVVQKRWKENKGKTVEKSFGETETNNFIVLFPFFFFFSVYNERPSRCERKKKVFIINNVCPMFTHRFIWPAVFYITMQKNKFSFYFFKFQHHVCRKSLLGKFYLTISKDIYEKVYFQFHAFLTFFMVADGTLDCGL
jgi:hypothetical protein